MTPCYVDFLYFLTLYQGNCFKRLQINGFESGDLTGWISANASVESVHLGVMPHSGSHMAVMGVGGSGLPLPDDDALHGSR